MPVAQAPMTTQGAAPFVWGSNGAMLTPDQVAQQRQIAQAMIANAAAPQNVGEGLSAIGKALIARSMMDDANSAQATGQQSAAAAFSGLGDNPSLGTLEAAAGNPFLSDGQSSVVKAMLQQKLQQSDPAYQLDMQYKRAQMGQIGAIPGYQKMPDGTLQPIAGGPSDPNNPQNSIELETKRAILGIDHAKMQGGFFGDSDTAAAQRIVMTGDPASKQYSLAYQFLFGPKTQQQQTPNGIVTFQVQNPPPPGVAPPTYGGPAGAPSVDPSAPPPSAVMPMQPAPVQGAAPMQQLGGAVNVIPGTRPSPTETQQRYGILGHALTQDLPTALKNYDALTNIKGQVLDKLPGGNLFQSPSYRQAAFAAKAAVSNIVYALSGANSTPAEKQAKIDEVTPQIGDDPGTVALKKQQLVSYVLSVADASNDPALSQKAHQIADQLMGSTGAAASGTTSAGVKWSIAP